MELIWLSKMKKICRGEIVLMSEVHGNLKMPAYCQSQRLTDSRLTILQMNAIFYRNKSKLN